MILFETELLYESKAALYPKSEPLWHPNQGYLSRRH